MSDCQITIEPVNGSGPFLFGAPTALTAIGRSTPQCSAVEVEVKLADGTPVWIGTTATTSAQADPSEPLKRKWSASFGPPVGLYIACGAELEVHARCIGGPCDATRTVPVVCKPEPPTITFPNLCYWLAFTYTNLLLLACGLLVIGIALGSPTVGVVSAAAFAAAGAAWLSWLSICAPGPCARFGTAAWIFKRSTAASIPIALALLHVGGASVLLIVLAFGAAAGIAVHGLERHRCRVPSITDSLASIL